MCWADSLAEETEVSSNKLSSSKLNSIPSAPAQKSQQQQQQPQYIPQYILQQKPIPQQQQQQPAMYILAQPGGASSQSQSPHFQQAVHQLLSYYNNNPQARLQLLQQQGGIPQNVPQSPLPSGGLHVVPSPQLEQNLGGIPGGAQHVYAVPASQSQYSLSPGLLAQLAAQSAQQAQPAQTQHYVAQQFPSQHLPAQFIAQQIPAQQFSAQQYTHQFPAQYTLSPQLASSLQAQGALGNIHFSPQAQFGLKQGAGAQYVSSSDFPSEKSQSSSNYTPVFRTTYVKG